MNTTFDRDWVLEELLPAHERERVGPALQTALDADCAILDTSGAVLWGVLKSDAVRQPLVVELEPIGYFAAAAAPARLAAAASLLRNILVSRSRYMLAASLHTEAVDADYEALRASEGRYKALSEALEQRVKDQVEQIEIQQRQLYAGGKLAAVGQLAAGVAHEINNPIGFIRSNLNSLRSYLEEFSVIREDFARASETWQRLDLDFALTDGRELLAECIDGADRVSRIVRDLKDFSSIDRAEEESIDINDCLRKALALVRRQLPVSITLSEALNPLPPRACHPGQLAEAFLNILQNAAQAVGEQGEITVSSRTRNDAIVIEISDSGCGIPSDRLERIFDPFYTTRPVGQGTGLGLTVTRDIVVNHGGTIDISSVPGKSTLVAMRFPL